MYAVLKLPLAAIENAYPLKYSICEPRVLQTSPPRTLVEFDESALEPRHSQQIENNYLEVFITSRACTDWIRTNIEEPSMMVRASNFIQGLFS